MKILICDAFDASLPEKLRQFGEVTDDKNQLPSATIALVRSKTKCTKEWIDQARNLRLIIRGGVGLDNVEREYAKSKGITVKNTPEASSIAVAEMAIALMITLASRIVPGHQGMVANKWLKKQCKRTELYQKTLGLIGCGRIGRETAKRAKAFGMKVIGYDAYCQRDTDLIEFKESTDDLFAEADYISLHVDLNDSTRGMINKDSIAKMKNGVIIINTARGKCVVEEDVAAALNNGKLGGYGNDVWYSDPPESSPLIGAPNTVLTPHTGASTKENLLRIGDIILREVAEASKAYNMETQAISPRE